MAKTWGRTGLRPTRALGSLRESDRLRDELDAARSQIEQLERERSERLRRDPRAGVLTRDAFRESAARALHHARRAGSRAAVVLVDIDGFRAFNGRHGAAAGDEALAALGAQVRDLVRAGDVVGRTGADEIAVLLPDGGAEAARGCAERLVGVLEVAGLVTISAGVAADDGTGDLDALLAAAAAGVEHARAAGGGRVGAPARSSLAAGHAPVRGAAGALALALAAKDRDTGEHAQEVVALAGAVARRLGLHGEEVERIASAALLHDIGKIGVPDAILRKPGGLTADEWDVVRAHPEIGERILRAVPGLGPVARLVRHAHERFDGDGYPDGLAGEAIPLGSRIVLACDAYDAMTSDRPYRPSIGHDAAIVELRSVAGTQLDPKVVAALLEVVAERAASAEPAAAIAWRG
jgi:diguanylate cyclase (GGDEF)-like protein